MLNAEKVSKHAYSAVVSYTIDMFWSKPGFLKENQLKRMDMQCSKSLLGCMIWPSPLMCFITDNVCFSCGSEIPH